MRAYFILNLQLNTKFKLKSPQTNISVTIFSSLRKLLNNKANWRTSISCGYWSPTCRGVCLSWWKWICKYNSRKPYFHFSLTPLCLSITDHVQLILVINRGTRIEYYANKFSTLIPIKPLGLIVHSLCFQGVNIFAIECIHKYNENSPTVRA